MSLSQPISTSMLGPSNEPPSVKRIECDSGIGIDYSTATSQPYVQDLIQLLERLGMLVLLTREFIIVRAPYEEQTNQSSLPSLCVSPQTSNQGTQNHSGRRVLIQFMDILSCNPWGWLQRANLCPMQRPRSWGHNR